MKSIDLAMWVAPNISKVVGCNPASLTWYVEVM